MRARDASGLDWDHLAEEVEDLWTRAAYALAMLLHACIELCDGGERHEAYMYHWQDAAFDDQHAMLRSVVKDSPSLRTVLADLLPEVYAEARRELMANATPATRPRPRRGSPERTGAGLGRRGGPPCGRTSASSPCSPRRANRPTRASGPATVQRQSWQNGIGEWS